MLLQYLDTIEDVPSRSIYLRWPKFSEATSYRVTATAVHTVGHSLLAHFNDLTLKGTLTTLIPNTIYAIQAEAIDKNGVLLAETQIMQSTAPDIPVIGQAYSKLSNRITVEWRAIPGATSYLLTAHDGDSFIETEDKNSPGTVTGLKPATLYRITIRSINSGGKSQPSPFRKAKTGGLPTSYFKFCRIII
ncbi:fibronectin type III domain-containing protein 7 [Pterocles gutturalis]